MAFDHVQFNDNSHQQASEATNTVHRGLTSASISEIRALNEDSARANRNMENPKLIPTITLTDDAVNRARAAHLDGSETTNFLPMSSRPDERAPNGEADKQAMQSKDEFALRVNNFGRGKELFPANDAKSSHMRDLAVRYLNSNEGLDGFKSKPLSDAEKKELFSNPGVVGKIEKIIDTDVAGGREAAGKASNMSKAADIFPGNSEADAHMRELTSRFLNNKAGFHGPSSEPLTEDEARELVKNPKIVALVNTAWQRS